MDLKIDEDVHNVVSSWLSRKDPMPQSWGGDMDPISPMSFETLQKLGIAGCSVLISRARKTAYRLKALSNLLNELSSAVQMKSDLAQTNFQVVGNMCSLVTLPNDLLARIFEAVVNGDKSVTNQARWKAAIALSHVNQYFRDTALSCAQMWLNIGKNADVASLSLSRSKGALLDVELVVEYKAFPIDESRRLVFERFLLDALRHSNRWRKLDILLIPHYGDGELDSSIAHQDTHDAFRVADVRSLESLSIRNHGRWMSSFGAYHDFLHWDAPNLRHVTTEFYFPLSLPALANVTSLDILLTIGEIKLADVLKDLARMKVLDDFVLKLETGGDEIHNQPLEKTEIPSVRRLRVETGLHTADSESILETLFSSLHFPGVIDLHVLLSGPLSKTFSDDDYETLQLDSVAEGIFRHREQFPRVEHFLLEAFGVNDFDPKSIAGMVSQHGCISLSIPLNVFPSLRHFVLSTNRWLDVHETVVDEPDGVPEAQRPPLETVTIIIPWRKSIRGVAKFMEDVLLKQKYRGQWDEFPELVIVDAGDEDSLLKERRTRRYKGDAALAWSKRHNKWSAELSDEEDEEK